MKYSLLFNNIEAASQVISDPREKIIKSVIIE